MRPDAVTLAGDVMPLAADLLTLVASARRVVREHPLRAAQVGDAHRRQQNAAQLFGRKRDRDAENATEDAVLAEDVPEGLAFPEESHAGLAGGDLIPADSDRPARRP